MERSQFAWLLTTILSLVGFSSQVGCLMEVPAARDPRSRPVPHHAHALDQAHAPRPALTSVDPPPLHAPSTAPRRGGTVAAKRPLTDRDSVAPASPIVSPSHDRPWKAPQALLPHAEVDDQGATVYNVRQCRWNSEEDFRLRHGTWKFRWIDVASVDFIVVPFQSTPQIAHTMLSFGLRDGRYLVASIEARQEVGESYSPTLGAMKQYELIYVLGDEQDVVGLRAEARRDDVYIHRSIATAGQSGRLLRDILTRTNTIHAHPEFYDTLTNNCTTNLVDHINACWPELVPANDPRLFLPGHSDQLAFQLGLLQTILPFDQARQRAYVSGKARQHIADAQFSQWIRR
jgi:hypothetical protein